ncbi:MAG: hypothetical protein K9I29_10060 [Bacteroidales bacterium]|nr:hypothetical protein [Bacteroidales bacterium]MCF8328625.1 hypothetical protein [Bacteroidales bacterium]
MRLELGLCYQVQKADGTTVKFKFVGNNPDNPQELQVEIDGQRRNLNEILQGGYLAYWEVDCD